MTQERLPRVAWAVWLLFALVTVEVFVTYTRVPALQLYHVSHTGVAGGLSRVVLLLNFPVALVAAALAWIAADRIATRAADLAAAAATVLCAVVAVPGVVDQSALDVGWINAVPAVGVALALALTVRAARAGASDSPRLPLDRARRALAALLLVAGIPWLLAELGFTVSHVPLLRDVFYGNQVASVPGQETLMAVHLGHHHGADGVYLALTALLLSRALPQLRRPRLRAILSGYLALMLAYGLAQVIQDGWGEQFVKRGWASRPMPNVLHPALTLWWAGIVLVAAALELGAWRRERAT